jgi:hypothetical protein
MKSAKRQTLTSVPLYYADFPLKPNTFYQVVVLTVKR